MIGFFLVGGEVFGLSGGFGYAAQLDGEESYFPIQIMERRDGIEGGIIIGGLKGEALGFHPDELFQAGFILADGGPIRHGDLSVGVLEQGQQSGFFRCGIFETQGEVDHVDGFSGFPDEQLDDSGAEHIGMAVQKFVEHRGIVLAISHECNSLIFYALNRCHFM